MRALFVDQSHGWHCGLNHHGAADAGQCQPVLTLPNPYSLTTLGQAMGYKYWHACGRLMTTIAETTGVDIKSFDNKYHCAIMNGAQVQSHRYSDAFRELLEKVRSGEEYASEVIREAEQKGRR